MKDSTSLKLSPSKSTQKIEIQNLKAQYEKAFDLIFDEKFLSAQLIMEDLSRYYRDEKKSPQSGKSPSKIQQSEISMIGSNARIVAAALTLRTLESQKEINSMIKKYSENDWNLIQQINFIISILMMKKLNSSTIRSEEETDWFDIAVNHQRGIFPKKFKDAVIKIGFGIQESPAPKARELSKNQDNSELSFLAKTSTNSPKSSSPTLTASPVSSSYSYSGYSPSLSALTESPTLPLSPSSSPVSKFYRDRSNRTTESPKQIVNVHYPESSSEIVENKGMDKKQDGQSQKSLQKSLDRLQKLDLNVNEIKMNQQVLEALKEPDPRLQSFKSTPIMGKYSAVKPNSSIKNQSFENLSYKNQSKDFTATK